MNTGRKYDHKSPASLVMFAMMVMALAASQLHESEIAQASVQPVIIQLQSSMNELDGLHRKLLEAKQLTIAGAVLIEKRRDRKTP